MEKFDDNRVSIEISFGFSRSLDSNTILDAKQRIKDEIKKKFPELEDYRLSSALEVDSEKRIAKMKGEVYFDSDRVFCMEGCHR